MKTYSTRHRLSGAIAFAAASFGVVAGSRSLAAQTPEASPDVLPVGGVVLPDGPLGEHIQWILDTANAGAGKVKIADVMAHFDPVFFETVTMGELFGTLADLQSAGITYELDPMIITTMDLPASNGNFVLIGSDGSRTAVSIQIDHDSTLITGFTIQPEGETTPAASPAA
jgi:hypothetical protein